LLRTQKNDIIRKFEEAGKDELYNAYQMFRLSKHGPLPPIDLTSLQLLRLTSSFHSSEPGDTIYALLGLTTRDHHPIKAPFMKADHSAGSLEDFRATVVENLMHLSDPPLQLLSNVQY
jgi:hypothetical protein